ncbi:hypothetical protein [Okeania sp. KiyG1]|uniref:hypothetical protein n=1 Tax=Okeania sp. KiyG1 TaxID=2720165 RepID=UPI001F40583F|nr:hypothetical protein [Okeania sp. KiyG1]
MPKSCNSNSAIGSETSPVIGIETSPVICRGEWHSPPVDMAVLPKSCNSNSVVGNETSPVISCPVASVLYGKGKEEGRRKKEERRGRKATLARKKPLFPVDIHRWVYTNDINGHDIIGSETKQSPNLKVLLY